MELRVLNYFLMTAREENMTKAAELLHVSQPTLSRQLMQLEEELGVKLFKRSSHSIVLTSEGMLLKRRAQEILSLSEKARQELTVSSENLSGTISIGCGELRSVSELGSIIAVFREKYPLVQFEFYSGNSDSIKLRMEQGTLDMGLLLEPVDIHAYEFVRMNTKEEWCALVRQDSTLAKKMRITPKDLSGVPLLFSGRNTIQKELSAWFGEHYQNLDRMGSFNLPYNAAVMVQNGIGTALSLRLDCIYENVKQIPLYPKLELTSVLAWKEHQILSPLASVFIDFAKKRIKGE